MDTDKMGVQVKATIKLYKYAEGQIPGVDEPYEVIDKEIMLTEAEAQKALKELEVK